MGWKEVEAREGAFEQKLRACLTRLDSIASPLSWLERCWLQLRVCVTLAMQHFSLESALTDSLDIVAVIITNLYVQGRSNQNPNRM